MRRSIFLLAVMLLVAGCGASSKIVEILRSIPAAPPSSSQSPAPSSAGPGGSAPAIVVATPRPEDEVMSPVTVSGTADVREGVVSIRILDAQGQELAAFAAQISCGSGCRGKFSAELAFITPERQAGLVQVFEANAAGGPPVSLVEIPVTLVPGA